MNDEFYASVEHQLVPGFAVRLTGIYTRTSNVQRVQNNLRPYGAYDIPVTNPDPGPDGRVGTADDPGTAMTYYEYPVELQGREFQEPMIVGDPGATRTYRSVEVAASKRMSNRWMMMASYSATRIHIPIVQNTSGEGNDFAVPGIGLYVSTVDPNAEINVRQDTWEWQARLNGAYELPYGVQLSANFEHRSGIPYARTVLFRGGQTIPTIRLRVEEIGARHTPHVNLMHLRAQKVFDLGGPRLTWLLNLFNVTNTNVVEAVNSLSGPAFERPTNIMLPRIAELAMQYSF